MLVLASKRFEWTKSLLFSDSHLEKILPEKFPILIPPMGKVFPSTLTAIWKTLQK